MILGRDSARYLWAGQALNLGLRFVQTVLIAKLAGPAEMGIYLAATALLMLFPRMADLGLPHAFSYYLRLRPQELRAATLLVVRHALLAGPLFVAAVWLLQHFPFGNRASSLLVAQHVWLLAGLCIALTISSTLLGTLVALQRFRLYCAAVACAPLAFVALLAALHDARIGATQLALILVLSESLAAALLLFFCLRTGDAATTETSAYYRYGLRAHAGLALKVLGQRLDRIILAALLPPAAYAFYGVASALRDVSLTPGNLHAMTLRNRQIDLAAGKNDLPGARRLFVRNASLWLAGATVVALALWPAWEYLLARVFGAPFRQAAPVAALLFFSVGPLAVCGFAWNHLFALNRPAAVAWLMGASAVLGAVALYFFTLRYGVQGAAGAVLGTALFSAALSTVVALKEIGV